MRVISAGLILAMGASMAEARQESAAERLRDRIQAEVGTSLVKLRRELKALAVEELAKAGIGAAAPKEDKEFARELDRHAKKLADDELNGRLKKFLLTPAAKPIVLELMAQAGVESVEEAMEMFFEKGDDGKLRVREEFADQVLLFLEQVDPAEKPVAPKAAPKVGFLGFKPEALTSAERLHLGLASPKGVRAFEIVEGSPADKAGMEKDDVLLSIAGKELSIETVDNVMNTLKPGESVAVVYYRDRAKHTIQVTLGSR